jgi:CheY-like chemotaxis protein
VARPELETIIKSDSPSRRRVPDAEMMGTTLGARPSQRSGAPARSRDGLVAVVFDKDHFFREFQALLLGQHGFRVLAPEEPEAFSIDYLAKANPHLLVTEILLPGADGLELVQSVKRHPTLRKARVVVFSVLNAEARALACGADRFVQKPLMRDSFLRVVEEVTQEADRDPEESFP